MDGFLNLDKPFGFTSHDCVAKVRRLLHTKKVGHAGTLDPAATGVLPIAIGRATRLLQYLPQGKAYRATVRFGLTTATDDLEGEILTKTDASALTLAAIEPQLPQFLGQIDQIPPSYSAIQVDGQRLYHLARSGQMITAPLRQVEVLAIEILDWRPGLVPELDLAISCGPGTYIRAIARDLGSVLGVGATLAALCRTTSSGFDQATSLTFDQLAEQVEQETFQVLDPIQALISLPPIILPEPFIQRWRWGQKLLLAAPADVTEEIPLESVAELGPNPEITAAMPPEIAAEIPVELGTALRAIELSATCPTVVRIHDGAGLFVGISHALIDAAGYRLVPQMVYAPMA